MHSPYLSKFLNYSYETCLKSCTATEFTYALFSRDDFSPKFVALFTILLFLKSFHWLAEDRVDYMERSPSISMLFHVRVISLAALVRTF